ncbi:alpha/beta hydrolase [Duganella sp. Leaf126]|uniref:alpha/beta hydrolase n=1 Tax=Duganella sp. Leaf126 TaxID=1736266 RepID=UPI0007009B19|nr:alpha/beta fold hydrolase [Duganella sp. Leaf126]KQQ31918.1 alpha/beta hydrolase [Duganella sp. Leaf126]
MRCLLAVPLLLFCAVVRAVVPAADFVTREVTLDVGGGTLRGTELAPAAVAAAGKELARVPVVVLHPGSGPTDRNGNSVALPGANDSLKMLAEGLAARGIASVRYDKRLIAASVSPQWTEADVRFDDYINDAVAWIRQLKTDPRFSKVVMVGHSEGAQIAAGACRRGATDGCVEIAGIGRSVDQVLDEQLKPHLSPELFAQHRRIVTSLKEGKLADAVPPELMMLYRPSVQPYLISSLRHDPLAAIAALTMPVLIVQGTSDLQVKVADAQALARAQPSARLVIVDGMNHLLKMVGDDQALQVASYRSNALPVAPQLLDAVAGFVQGL